MREHRVGSSPTSGTQEIPAKSPENQNRVKRLGENSEPLYTNYYTNALRKRVFHRFGGALLHRGKHVWDSPARADTFTLGEAHLSYSILLEVLGGAPVAKR